MPLVVLFVFMPVSCLGITLQFVTPVNHVLSMVIFKSSPKHSSYHAAVALLGAGQPGRQTSRKAAGSRALPQWGRYMARRSLRSM